MRPSQAPQHDTRALGVIARARELVPDKPLRYVVNTHHHFDHSGGLRAAVAEGLTVLTHETNQALYEELVSREHTITADHLAQNPAELMLETVTGDETYELRDGYRGSAGPVAGNERGGVAAPAAEPVRR